MMNNILFLNKNGNKAPIKILIGSLLKNNIYWPFTTVSLANNQNADDLQHALSDNYIGSNHYISDEGYVFNPSTYVLSDIFLNVPDDNFDGQHFLSECLKSQFIVGLPYLLEPKVFFAISVSNYKYLSRDGGYLICVSECEQRISYNDILRVRIHERLDLLFINGEHSGFILKDPFRSLVRFSGFDEEKHGGDKEIDLCLFNKAFFSYFDMMESESWDNIDNNDINIRNGLLNILESLEGADKSKEPIFALQEQCQRLLSDYYSC
ncbi:hypothetical protein FE392_18740 [Xenorhabdus sp. 12]|uniref:Uncharacterized protein n=1 Tax=Xenorhabdus santafensis TaxID=2582833 RepID=A0ABU4SET4_9GAMM|nr:hypothetical protein [Xenorhabdus sp. 12]MDX7989312.1 hypothetical protein [Xenorhabdus sp. 12]